MELQDKMIVVLEDFDEIYILEAMYKKKYPSGCWLTDRNIDLEYLRSKHERTPLGIRIEEEICGYAEVEFYKNDPRYSVKYRIIEMHCLSQPQIDDAAFFAMLEGEWQ